MPISARSFVRSQILFLAVGFLALAAVIAVAFWLGERSAQLAEQILAALSGKRHEVLTAVALKYGEQLETVLSRSEVQFRELSPREIQDYVATGECNDKAGAYAIQGRAAMFVREIRGSHSGIVGLPLYETAQLLQTLGPLHDRRNPD